MARGKSAISLGVSALIVIALIIVVGFGVYLNSTFNTTSTTTSSISLCQGLHCSTTTLNTTSSTTHGTTTETVTSNYTEASSAAVASSETTCIPSGGSTSTITVDETSTTQTLQEVYDGTPCNFGDNIFEPPSAILIPANTLVWTNFRLNVTTNDFVGVSISFFPFPEAVGANIIVAIYLNDSLIANSTTLLPDNALEEVTNSSLIPSSNSSNNSVFTLTGVTPTVGMGTQTGSAVSLNGATISIAMVSDKPLWLAGWTPKDMSKGTGPQFGQSNGQLNGTYEWAESSILPPNSLPQPTTTLTFELQFTGDYFP